MLTEQQVKEIARRLYEPRPLERAFRSAFFLYPASLTLAVGLWYLTIGLFSVPAYLLSTPHAVVLAGLDNIPLIAEASWVTLTEIVAAFLVCLVVGIPTGLLIASSRITEKLISPLLVLSQGVPKIALAPVLLAWFGFGFKANLAIGFLIAVFPIVVNTVLGMHTLDPVMVRLGRSAGASKWRLFWVIRLPTALPSIFAGMKISVTFAAVGAIIGEFAAGDAGLGYVIQVTIGNLEMPLGFAAILATAMVGLITYMAVEAIERIVLRTRPKNHE